MLLPKAKYNMFQKKKIHLKYSSIKMSNRQFRCDEKLLSQLEVTSTCKKLVPIKRWFRLKLSFCKYMEWYRIRSLSHIRQTKLKKNEFVWFCAFFNTYFYVVRWEPTISIKIILNWNSTSTLCSDPILTHTK